MTRPLALLLSGASVLSSALALAGCSAAGSDSSGSSEARSDVLAAGSNTPASAQKTAPPSTAAGTAAPRKKLCGPSSTGKTMSSAKLGHLEASGAKSVGDKIESGEGTWTWVNLWAAYCGPCKEEIPRILAFKQKLADAGVKVNVAFLSLDDDERQAKKFLESQPAGGLKSSFFLDAGKDRSQFLSDSGIKETYALPVQILVDPKDNIRCVAEGAIDDADFAELSSIFSTKK